MEILIVDDDRGLVEFVTVALRRSGYTVTKAHDAPSLTRRMQEEKEPDLVILDVNLGPWNGFELLKDLRARSQVPVIMLTGRAGEEDKVVGLEGGADDYVTKPFSTRELLARIRSNLRRKQLGPVIEEVLETRFVVGPLVLDTQTHSVTKAGEVVKVTVTEFRLLSCLMQNAGAVVPTRTLLRKVWGYDDAGAADIVRVTVHRLRRKIEDDPASPRYLRTIPGVGVMCAAPADGAAPEEGGAPEDGAAPE